MSRVQSIIRHIKKQYSDYSPSECIFHTNKPCLTLLNNFDTERFHCLFANQSVIWRSYSITNSCDLPDHVYDLILLNRLLGSEYVLPFASFFRESSGYTVAMFRQQTELYTPIVINRQAFKVMIYALLVIFISVGHRFGGSTPDIKYFSFAFTRDHPVLCDIGGMNAEKKELIDGKENFNRKKWIKFLRRKKTISILRYLKLYYPNYFQKKKKGTRCILYEVENRAFDDETHQLVCHDLFLIEALENFKHLMPDRKIREELIPEWISLA